MREVAGKLFGTLYNTYKFFALYANVDGFTGKESQIPYAERPRIDRWILSLLNTLVREVDTALDDYEPTKAARAIVEFVGDNLSNWYVRLNRKRFWAGEMTSDKLSAYQTLYTCLCTLARLMAPIAPFYSDRLYSDLTAEDDYNTVHLARFPQYDTLLSDAELESQMRLAQEITSAVLALRRKVNIKVRQPLQTLLVPVSSATQAQRVEAMAELIKGEVNIKELKIVDGEESGLVKRVKADFKKLGPRFGKIMKQLGASIKDMSQAQIAELEREGRFTFSNLEGTPTVTLDDVEVLAEDIPGWSVGTAGDLTVALDITVTPVLKNEGVARELINRIQNIRKASDFDITDKVNVILEHNPVTDAALADFADYISTQVLAASIKATDVLPDENVQELELDDVKVRVSVARV